MLIRLTALDIASIGQPVVIARGESTLVIVFNTLRLLPYKKYNKFENPKFFKSKVLKIA